MVHNATLVRAERIHAIDVVEQVDSAITVDGEMRVAWQFVQLHDQNGKSSNSEPTASC